MQPTGKKHQITKDLWVTRDGKLSQPAYVHIARP